MEEKSLLGILIYGQFFILNVETICFVMLTRFSIRSKSSATPGKPTKLRTLHTTSRRHYTSQHKPPTNTSVKPPHNKRSPFSPRPKPANILPHKPLVKTQEEKRSHDDNLPDDAKFLQLLPEVLDLFHLLEAFDMIYQLDSERFQWRNHRPLPWEGWFNREPPWVVSVT